MPKIKHTKTELKAQREVLRRYERFLPMLQLKKQQLQLEIQAIDARIEANRAAESHLRAHVQRWVKLFSEAADLQALTRVAEVATSDINVAGISIPVLEQVRFERADYDLFQTPPWVDDGLDVLEARMRLNAERAILNEQRALVSEELRTTSQRVNLFEKVKIPESRENIRVIRIFIGDEQTAAVARAKFAKSRVSESELDSALYALPETADSGNATAAANGDKTP